MRKRKPTVKSNKQILALPQLNYYNQTYAAPAEYEDERSLGVLRDFESLERQRALQTELQWIREGRVNQALCRQEVGARRIGKYRTPEHWAEWMLKKMAEGR